MNRLERTGVLNELLLAALDGRQAEIWTSMPAIVQSVNFAEATCVVQVAIQGTVLNPNGSTTPVNTYPLVDCPIMFAGGGGFTATFPIATGDECMVFFASRCIDAWWQNGGYANPQAEFRLHDISDGFVFIGPRSLPRVLNGISSTTMQLRSDDGSTYVELTRTQIVNVVAPGGMTITTPILTLHGQLEADDDVISNNGNPSLAISLNDHAHSGVVSGGSNTGPPVPGT